MVIVMTMAAIVNIISPFQPRFMPGSDLCNKLAFSRLSADMFSGFRLA